MNMSDRITPSPFSMNEDDSTKSTSKKRARTAFTPQHRAFLEAAFHHNTLPSTSHIEAIAKRLDFKAKVIRTWFQNRRTYARKRTQRQSFGNRVEPPDCSEYVYNKPSNSPSFQPSFNGNLPLCLPTMTSRSGLSTRNDNTTTPSSINHMFDSSMRPNHNFTHPPSWNTPPFPSYYPQFNPYLSSQPGFFNNHSDVSNTISMTHRPIMSPPCSSYPQSLHESNCSPPPNYTLAMVPENQQMLMQRSNNWYNAPIDNPVDSTYI